MPPQLRLNPRRSAECEGALFFGLLSNFTTDSARQARQAYWPPILQTSSTLGNEPLKSVKSHTVTVEIETPRRAPLGESVVVTGLELTGFIKDHPQYGLEVILEHPKQIKLVD